MIHLLWLLVASSSLQPGQSVPMRPDSAQAAASAAVPMARAGASLALPPIESFKPELSAAGASPQRPRAIEFSDFYYTRLAVHRIASYATLPLSVAEYLLGQKLYSNPPGSQGTRQSHRVVALGIAGLFGVNTVTGLWNLWDSRKDPSGRARRYIHAALMLAADAGFVVTGSSAPSPRRISLSGPSLANRHRTLAIASMSTALVSYGMMLVWKN